MEKEHDCLEIPLESNHVTRSDRLRASDEKLFDGRFSAELYSIIITEKYDLK